jgi:murein DD-endopeptidase MepM/ murein hydrolase activator NlpD
MTSSTRCDRSLPLEPRRGQISPTATTVAPRSPGRQTPSRRERPGPPTRPWRVAVLGVLAAVILAYPSAASAACWAPPVQGVVTDPFRAPACRWCPGNRGLEYRVEPGTVVRAATGGTVTFAGTVAGTIYVVVRSVDGWLLTYGRLASRSVGTADRVLTGAPIGVATGQLFFGVRVGGRYVDPAPYLGRLVGRPRLVPADGRAPRPAPPARLRCPAPAVW